MLQACMINFKGSWDKYVSLLEFAYNNSFHQSIGMALYEALYRRLCRNLVCWDEVSKRSLIGPKIIQDTIEKAEMVKKNLEAAQDRQKSYAYLKRKEIEYAVGDRVFLKVSPWKGEIQFRK